MKTRFGGRMLMLDGYTFSKMGSEYIYYCSKKDKTTKCCKAKVKLDKNFKIINYEEIQHNHSRPLYILTKYGEYTRISS